MEEKIKNNLRVFANCDVNADYEDFSDFLENNKDIIYRKTVKLYREFLNTAETELRIVVKSTLNGRSWTTDLVYSKHNTELLGNDILDFFEEKEEYEICGEIVKIMKQL